MGADQSLCAKTFVSKRRFVAIWSSVTASDASTTFTRTSSPQLNAEALAT